MKSQAIVVVALAALLTTACSGLRRAGPQIDRTEDVRIAEEVRSRLAAEPSLDAGQIRVDVDGRVVNLHGNVQGMGQWNCAIRNAELVLGVNTVVDHLLISRGPRETDCRAPRPGS